MSNPPRDARPISFMLDALSIATDSKTYLSTLPVEIIIRVLKCCSTLDVVKSQLICRLLRNVIRDTPELQYKIECYLAGVSEGPAVRSLDVTQRLGIVGALRRTWRNPGPSWKGKPAPIKPVKSYGGGQPHTDGTVYATVDPDNKSCMEFTRIPSRLRRISEKRWTIDRLPQIPVEYAFDCELDLLVLLYVREETNQVGIMLLSCTTGDAHPLGATPKFEVPFGQTFRRSRQHCCVKISADLVGFVVQQYAYWELWVFNWKEGNICVNLHTDLMSFVHASSFAFLDDSRILVLCQLKDPEQHDEDSFSVAVFDCTLMPRTRMHENQARDLSLLALGLPGPFGWGDITSLNIHCHPTSRRVGENELFKRNKSPPVILIEIAQVWENTGYAGTVHEGEYDETKMYDLLIPSRVITSRISSHANDGRDGTPGAHPDIESYPRNWTPWASWRIETRLFNVTRVSPAYLSQPRVFGSRYITLKRDSSREILIYDFDSLPALRQDRSWHGRPEATTHAAPYREIATQQSVRNVNRPGTYVRLVADGFVLQARSDDLKNQERFTYLSFYTV